MAFATVVHDPAYRQVAAQLREAILTGALPTGAALPPERELCERFGVGRTTVREALRVLEAQRLVVAGRPTEPPHVAMPDAVSRASLSDALDNLVRLAGTPVGDIVELRCALEAAAVERTARIRPTPDLGAAREALEQMRDGEVGAEAFERADVAFHLALVHASGNGALEHALFAVRDAIATHLRAALRRAPQRREELRRLAREHRELLEAVEAGEAERAGALLRAHVAGFYERTMAGA